MANSLALHGPGGRGPWLPWWWWGTAMPGSPASRIRGGWRRRTSAAKSLVSTLRIGQLSIQRLAEADAAAHELGPVRNRR